MRGFRIITVLVAVSVMVGGVLPVVGQSPSDVPHGPAPWLHDRDWSGHLCRYPGPNYKRASGTASAVLRPTRILEVEPNDLPSNAQVITLSPGPVNPVDIDILGAVNVGSDKDRYRFTAAKGDVIGLAVLGSGSLDTLVAVEQLSGAALIENDNDGGKTYLYPPQSPFPSGVGTYDSALTWIAPAAGDYLIRVSSYASASRGDYTLQIRARRPSFESQNIGTTQIIFLDFDGETINAQKVFNDPSARPTAIMSPLRSFLTKWGSNWQSQGIVYVDDVTDPNKPVVVFDVIHNYESLSLSDEGDVVGAILTVVQEKFDALRQSTLNGNLDTDKVLGHFDVQILNSRDHADPWGQPNVSRVIVGGTVDQVGITTLGLASSIDPGNFGREDTAIVLLDQLSTPKYYVTPSPPDTPLDPLPPAPTPILDFGTINSIGLASGNTIIDAIGVTIGNSVVHEAGHFLGNWHTEPPDPINPQANVPCIMDEAHYPIWLMAGAGPDGILGSGDDQLRGFVSDVFASSDVVATGIQRTDVNTAFALATGRVQREEAPIPPVLTYPLASVRASVTSGGPPLTVEFAAGAIDDTSDVSFTWDFKDGSPVATGPIVSHVFSYAGTFLVKVTAVNSMDDTGSATILITVANGLPTAAIIASPNKGTAPLTVQFDGSTSKTANVGITPVSYAWDFGDGSTATGVTAQHTYANPGYYAAKLTFTDSEGGTSVANALITVSAPGSTTSPNAAMEAPTTAPAAPKCGMGGGVLMIGSCAGLFAMMLVRRRQ